MNPILGYTQPDPTGEMLGTGMMQFSSAVGVDGLCQELSNGDELILLVVAARQPGKGQFRNFIHQCKSNYKIIRVLEVWNDELRKTLLRYRFSESKWTDCLGECLNSMEWQGEVSRE